jgi:hypothetical protein
MESSSGVSPAIPNLPIRLSASEDTLIGIAIALGEQYQRLLQAKPLRPQIEAVLSELLPGIVPSLPMTPLGPCNGSIVKTKDYFEW